MQDYCQYFIYLSQIINDFNRTTCSVRYRISPIDSVYRAYLSLMISLYLITLNVLTEPAEAQVAM